MFASFVAAAVAWLVLLSPALAQEAWLPATGSPWVDSTKVLTGHAWVAAPVGADALGREQYAVLHSPPRDAAQTALPGTLRPVTKLAALPEVMAAWEGRLHIIFPPSAGAGQVRQRRVVGLSAVMSKYGVATWEYMPAGGPEVRPSLPGDGQVLAACGTALGPAVLTRGMDGTEGFKLRMLRGETWIATTLPSAFLTGNPGWTDLCATREGPLLAWATPEGRITWATGKLSATTSDGVETVSGEWSVHAPVELGSAWAPPPVARGLQAPRDRRLVWADGQLALVQRQGDEPLRLIALRGTAAHEITTLPGIPAPVGVAPLDGLGRLIAVHMVQADAATEPVISGHRPAERPPPRFHVTEVSLYTGQVLHSGFAEGKLFAGRALQVMMVAVGGIMLAVLMFVLRSESSTSLPIPDGLALGTPGRRLAAALIDGGLAVLISSFIYGVRPLEILSLTALLRPGDASIPLATAILIAFLSSALLEWLTGRTLGKRMLGLGVLGYRRPSAPAPVPSAGHADPLRTPVRVGDLEIGRPSLGQALIRNAIRWLVPPLAALVLFDPNWRHPGDVLARTVVLTAARPPEEPDAED